MRSNGRWRSQLDAREPVMIEAPVERAPPELSAQELTGQELPREVPSPPLGNVTPEATAPRAARAVPRAAPIIPLAAIPDDPGPEPQADTDAELAEPKPDAWQRILSAFPLKLP